MRGLPGSGKSWFAEHVLPLIFAGRSFIVSADYHFINDQGIYNFTPKELPEAHRTCRSHFLGHVQDYCDAKDEVLVVVDNTNTTPTEIAYYYDLATIFTDDVEILTVSPPNGMSWDAWVEQCAQVNQHGVPLKSIKDMGKRIKNNKLPWYWREKVVTREDGFFMLNGDRYEVTNEPEHQEI